MSILTSVSKRPIRAALAVMLAAALPVSAISAPEPLAAQTAATDFDRAVAALRAISTMKADFTQTDRQGQTYSGTLTLKRPGKIRFDYGKSADMLIVSNGKSLYMVDYAVKQVERWPIKNSPLGALLDPARDVKRYGKMVDNGTEGVVGIEVRDPKRPEFGVMTLIFMRDASAPGGMKLTHWVAVDAQNHRTTVRLKNHRYGVSVADSAFSFRDPRRSSRRPG